MPGPLKVRDPSALLQLVIKRNGDAVMLLLSIATYPSSRLVKVDRESK